MNEVTEVTPLSFFEEDITEEINHGIRVSNLAYYVAKSLGLYEAQCHELAVAGMVHEVRPLRAIFEDMMAGCKSTIEGLSA